MKMSDDEYKVFLEKRSKEIDEELNSLTDCRNKLNDASISLSNRINSLSIEKQELQSKLASYSNRDTFNERVENKITKVDQKFIDAINKEQALNDKIKELEEIKNNSNSTYMKNKVERRIEKINEKLKQLQTKKTKIVGKQRKIMYPKYKKEARKQKLLADTLGKQMTYEERMHANEQLRDELADKNVFGKMASKVYDFKAKHYKKKAERQEEILQEMKNKNSLVAMRGARVTSLSKKVVNKLKHGNSPSTTFTFSSEPLALPAGPTM